MLNNFFCWYSQIESKAVPNLAFLWQEIPCGCVSIFAYVCVWQTVSEIVPITLSSTLNCFALPLKWSLTFGGAAVRAKAFHCLWPYDLPATFMKKYSWMNRITFNKGKTQKHKMTEWPALKVEVFDFCDTTGTKQNCKTRFKCCLKLMPEFYFISNIISIWITVIGANKNLGCLSWTSTYCAMNRAGFTLFVM